MKDKFKQFYMKTAWNCAQLSHCQRLKTGAIIVQDSSIIAYGYNGTPRGDNNACEIDNVTKETVIHAEMNAIAKVARSTNSCFGASIFVTHSPCVECSKAILQAGIKHFYYSDLYRKEDGLQMLISHGILCEMVKGE